MIKINDTEYFSNDRTIRFLNMDCNEFMGGCKDKEFDLNLSDPPYGIGAGSKNFINGTSKTEKKYYKINDWDNIRPTEHIFNEIKRTSKNQIIWGGNYFADILGAFRCYIFWDKTIHGNSYADGEMAWTSFDSVCRYYRKNICQVEVEGERIHPTQKTIHLYKWILDNYTKPTDTILDCFGGSMSNAIACHMKRRKLTIIELDVDYFKSALNRFEIYERQVEDIKEFGYAKTKINAQNPVLF